MLQTHIAELTYLDLVGDIHNPAKIVLVFCVKLEQHRQQVVQVILQHLVEHQLRRSDILWGGGKVDCQESRMLGLHRGREGFLFVSRLSLMGVLFSIMYSREAFQMQSAPIQAQ